MRVLAIDVGGTHVKILATGQRTPRKVESGPTMTAAQMVAAVKRLAAGWSYDAVSIGYPGLVVHGRIAAEPRNLGRGWTGLDFRRAFGCPVRVINDAAMQALGSYRGGRMLFLGLGTGLGSALVVPMLRPAAPANPPKTFGGNASLLGRRRPPSVASRHLPRPGGVSRPAAPSSPDGDVEPMELAHLPYKKGRTYEDYVGVAGLQRLGKKKWRKHVAEVIELLKAALEADDVVVGGGNAKKLDGLPPGVRLGDNANAFEGGFRLWPGTEAASP